jgi:large subunit ribosomal protein L24
MWIKTSDTVEVITGKNRGTRGKVLRVVRDTDKVVVEGANRVFKHVKKSQKNPRGGQLSKEMPMAISNILLVCQACGAAARMGARFLADGSKERYCKKCGAANGQIAPAKARYAKK